MVKLKIWKKFKAQYGLNFPRNTVIIIYRALLTFRIIQTFSDEESPQKPVSKTSVGELKFGLLAPEQIDLYSDALNVYANLLYNGQKLQVRAAMQFIILLYSNLPIYCKTLASKHNPKFEIQIFRCKEGERGSLTVSIKHFL